jgi:hypothetical protein
MTARIFSYFPPVDAKPHRTGWDRWGRLMTPNLSTVNRPGFSGVLVFPGSVETCCWILCDST